MAPHHITRQLAGAMVCVCVCAETAIVKLHSITSTTNMHIHKHLLFGPLPVVEIAFVPLHCGCCRWLPASVRLVSSRFASSRRNSTQRNSTKRVAISRERTKNSATVLGQREGATFSRVARPVKILASRWARPGRLDGFGSTPMTWYRQW